MQKTLKTQQSIVYGPINSRRLGTSLGLNILPVKYKLCPYNCVYCQYGSSNIRTVKVDEYIEDLPSPKQISEALIKALSQDIQVDYITFSGNGEPTFHPELSDIIDNVVKIRDQYLPSADICVLSNSAFVWKKEVCDALAKVDVRIMKLDVGNEKDFIKINRPANGLTFRKVISGLKQLEKYYIQAVFFQGAVSNTSDKQIKQWIETIGELKPLNVQIYTTDRPTSVRDIEKVPMERLNEIAQKTRKETGVPVCVYGSTPVQGDTNGEFFI